MMFEFAPQIYGEKVTPWVAESRLMELGPGEPDHSRLAGLKQIQPATFCAQPADLKMANACLAAVWLYYDFLNESHELSQEIHTATGSYWHGIMHRREPDPGNSKYWFHRVGTHPIFAPLAEAARSLDPQANVVSAGPWDPFAFIDACEAARRGNSPHEQLCRQIQLVEWQLLFDYCFHAAAGK